MATAVFTLPEWTEIVEVGTWRYYELLNDGHTPTVGPTLPQPDPHPQYVTPTELSAQTAKYARTSGPFRIVDMGHSIAANGTLTYHPSGKSVGNGWILGGSTSYMAKALPQTEGRFMWTGTAATPGHTLAQIITDHLPDVLASDADFVHVNVLSNTVSLILAGTETLADMKASYDSGLISPLIAAGKTPIIAGLPPLAGTANAAPSSASRLLQRKVNAWLREFAAFRSLPFVDYAVACTDPATGAWRSGWSTDGTHPLNLGAKGMGDALAAVLNSIPGTRRAGLSGSYDTSLVMPDACITSVGSDKIAPTGVTTGGWGYNAISDVQGIWKGNRACVRRGSGGDYVLYWPVSSGFTWVAGHRIRLTVAIDVPRVPTNGSWSVGIYNLTDLQPVCGISGETLPATKDSVALAGAAAVSSGLPTITAPAGTFKTSHIGRAVNAWAGVAGYFAAGTTIIAVSADGTQATASANASATQATANLMVHGAPLIVTREFVVHSAQAGDNIAGYFSVTGADGVVGAVAQFTVEDLTALEVS